MAETLLDKKNRNTLIGSMFFSLIFVTILTSLSGTISGLIDSLAISHFCGDAAMASYSVAKPIFTLISLFTGIVTGGIQIVLSRELGKGNIKKASSLFTFYFIASLIMGIILLIVGLCLAPQLAFIFGAYDLNSDLNKGAADFFKGVLIGAPCLCLYTVLIPIFNFDGARKIVYVSAILNAVFDIIFDLLNGYYFKLGLFGMGLGTAAGYVIAFIPMLVYVLTKKSGLKLDFKHLSFKGTGEVLVAGLPKGTRKISSCLRSIVVNAIMVTVGGSIALSASGVENSIFGVLNVFVSCAAGALPSLVGLYCADKDKDSVKRLFKIINLYNVVLVVPLVAITIILAPQIVKCFGVSDPEIYKQSVLATQISLVALPISLFNGCYLSYIEVTKQYKYGHLLSFIQYFVSFAISFSIFGFTLGTIGLWIAMPMTEVISLVISIILSMIKNKKLSVKPKDIFEFDKIFGKNDENIVTFVIDDSHSIEEYQNEVKKYCEQHNIKCNNQLLLLTEEIINYYRILIKATKKKYSVDLMIQQIDDEIVFRIRDNIKEYSPAKRAEIISYCKEHPDERTTLYTILKLIKKTETVDILNIHNTKMYFSIN